MCCDILCRTQDGSFFGLANQKEYAGNVACGNFHAAEEHVGLNFANFAYQNSSILNFPIIYPTFRPQDARNKHENERQVLRIAAQLHFPS